MNRKSWIGALGTLVAVAVLAGTAYPRQATSAPALLADAYSSGEYDRVRSLQQRGAILPLEQILERARAHHDGKVLESELEPQGEDYIYEIELVDDQGQVWEMKFDAASGELLEKQQED